MADFSPTPSQREATENRGGALLVSAAAGSGKTRVLTERLMRYITDPDDPKSIDNFLVITYTRAAAAELRSRISDALAERVAADPGAKRLRRQSALCARAPIGTIHSFCAALLREYCHLLGLAPDFAVAEEDRTAPLRARALEKTMEAAYERPDPDFLLLADTVGAGRDDRRLAALVLTLYGKMQCHARPEAWAARQAEALSQAHADAGDTPWGAELLKNAAETAGYWAAETERLLSLMSAEGNERLMAAYAGSIGETAGALGAFSLAAGVSWDRARERLPIPFPRLGSLRNPDDPALAEFVKARRDACKKAAEKLKKDFAEPSEKLLADLAKTAPAMRALLALVLRFDERYAAEKRRRSLADFSDLEHLAARLLADENGHPTNVAREVSRRFTEVMVDEYQDVSEVQDLIIRSVSQDGRNLFMVGDVKQSVYRFRLADPAIFINKYLAYRDAAGAKEGEPRRVLLQENFRSRPEVLEAANAVFENLMSRALGGLDYDENARLRPGAVFAGAGETPELFLIAPPETDGGGDEERPDRAALEAAFAARKIASLVASGTLIDDHGVLRPAGYGDIAVLLRSANVWGGVYRRELARLGIPVLSDQAGGFFRAPEVTVMLSLLAVIDNPRQDVPLIAALRSPLFCFTADELSAVRSRDMTGDFYAALTAAAEHDAKCRSFLDTLGRFRRLAPDMALGELLLEIYRALDCMALCCAAPDGAAGRENLTLLFELARQFEQSGYRGLRRFTLWLRAMDERGEEPRAASTAGGAVRIMSVHKSKGLEFPIVFLCDTARRFNKSDARGSVLVHPALGLGAKLTNADRGIEYPTLAHRAVAARMERETLSEELRLLYVAMTRARERLYITAALPDPDAVVAAVASSVTSPMAPQALAAMASPAHWLIAAALADGEKHLRLSVNGATEGAASAETEPADAPAPEESGPDIPVLAQKLDWAYPFASAVALPSKITATELKSLGSEDPEAAALPPRAKRSFRRPKLGGERRLTAAEKGTATHLVLRYLDFAKTGSIGEIENETARLLAAGRISESEAAAVDKNAILRLFASDIGKRMREADVVLREFPFTLLCPASAFFPGGGEDEILLQGVADCCIEEDGYLTVIDYKTDGVSEAEAEERARAYAPQVKAYALAMGRVTGKPVRACVLYFLRPGTAVLLAPQGENGRRLTILK